MRVLDRFELYRYYVSELEIALRKLRDLEQREKKLYDTLIEVRLHGPAGVDIPKLVREYEDTRREIKNMKYRIKVIAKKVFLLCPERLMDPNACNHCKLAKYCLEGYLQLKKERMREVRKWVRQTFKRR